MAILKTYPEASDPFKAGTHSGLDFAYGAGRVRSDNTITDTVAGTVTLADDTTNYIEVDPSDGTVSDNAVGFTAGSIPLYTVVTAASAISTVTDKRAFLPGTSGSSILTTKGDLLVYTTAETRLAAGTNDHVLTADSTQAAGIKWAAPAAPTAHDLGGASHTADTLANLNTKISNATLTGMHISINEQADSYTLVIGDDGKLIDMAKGTAQTLTVPKNSAVAFTIGTQILVRQKGAGQVTIAPVDVDVTLNSASAALKTVAQYSVAGLIKVATDIWAVFGDVEA